MTRREAAEQEMERDRKKSVAQLLADVHDESLDPHRSGDQTGSRVTARFASLLVVLGEQADKSTQENLEMQRKVVRLTWGLFWLTLALTFVAAIQIYLLLQSS